MEDTSRLWGIGAWLYVLWGVLHVVVGAVPLVQLGTSGAESMLAFHEFEVAAVEGPMVHASHIIAEHSANLIAFGILAIIVARTLIARRRPLGVWTNAVVLGIVDISIVLAEMVPGHVPLLPAGIGPALYVAALAVTVAAVVSSRDADAPADGNARHSQEPAGSR